MRSARAATITAVLVLSACSSAHHAVSKRAPSTSSRASTSTTVTSTTTTASSAAISRSTAPPTTLRTSPSVTVPLPRASTVHIDTFTGPPSPVECNAPTMVELRWTTRGAARVEMHIDGGNVFATYPNGSQDHLLPLACDSRTHTYELVAIAGAERADKTLTIATKSPS